MVWGDSEDQSLKSERTWGRGLEPARTRSLFARENPTVAAILAGLTDHFRLVGGVSQHDHFRLFRQRQLANEIGRCFGSGPVFQTFLPAVFARAIRDRERDPNPGRGDEQTHRKAVTALAGSLVLAIAPPFFGTPLTIACTVRVLGPLSLLTAERGVDDEQKTSLARFLLQELLPQKGIEIEPAKART